MKIIEMRLKIIQELPVSPGVLVVLAWSRPGLAEVSQELSPAQSVSERVPDREFPATFMTHSPAPPSHITGESQQS